MVSPPAAVLALCPACIPHCAALLASPSGSRSPCRYRHQTRPSPSCVLHQSTADENTLHGIHIPEECESVQTNNDGGIELWLDLRSTSLTPKTALELWHVLDDDVIEKAPFVKCLVSSQENAQSSIENKQAMDVLVVAESDGEDMESIFLQRSADRRPSPLSTSSIRPDKPAFGSVLPLKASSSRPVLPDPLPAMEAVSRGQWIVLDTHGWSDVEEAERLSTALSLVELLSAGALRSGGGDASYCDGGGIGLTCHTKHEMVEAAMFIRSLTNGGGGGCTKTLESGIVVPDDGADTASAAGGGMRRRSDKVSNFAIVVPYYLELLQTAKLLFGESVEQGEDMM